ncbi:LOG family protein [Auraticoccus monumenti]|uniref:Predicted Rossmann fold nucleotide-binding protein n=1 Tax=Auraticoccus monumenti TaxID=675864 RepID=A0A1G7D9U8_9ACTN|nr:LOG family protein [Auraticoccus monumenti]SDE48418.1 Predicted Rossmann fold nucleotide-binding protein [Auraticoccus monumenti]
MSRRTLDVHDLAEFDQHAAATSTLAGWFLQSVDLTRRSEVLRRLDPAGAVFLGCRMDEADVDSVRARGALVFPRLPGVPFDPYRGALYTAAELYGLGAGPAAWTGSPDAGIYTWWRGHDPEDDLGATLATSLHDHAVSDALDERLAALGVPAVGVMGGHAVARDSPAYAGAARLGRALATAGRVVLTGGGPGAMEAANLGARMSPHSEPALQEALALVAPVPRFTPSVDHWAATAAEVLRRWPVDGPARSIGVPTWFYGHEPPNLFADGIAKYFANALREDVLLQRCRAGLVYLPGAAGTVQEIFQAATENYYAADDTQVAPLVLVGREHWTTTLPAWPLLQALGRGRTMAGRLHLVDTVEEALEVLVG